MFQLPSAASLNLEQSQNGVLGNGLILFMFDLKNKANLRNNQEKAEHSFQGSIWVKKEM